MEQKRGKFFTNIKKKSIPVHVFYLYCLKWSSMGLSEVAPIRLAPPWICGSSVLSHMHTNGVDLYGLCRFLVVQVRGGSSRGAAAFWAERRCVSQFFWGSNSHLKAVMKRTIVVCIEQGFVTWDSRDTCGSFFPLLWLFVFEEKCNIWINHRFGHFI